MRSSKDSNRGEMGRAADDDMTEVREILDIWVGILYAI